MVEIIPDVKRTVGALQAENVRLSFGSSVVVDEVSVQFRPGEVTALVGPNGSGKSTLLRALARLHKLTTGSVDLDGDDVERLRRDEFARRITLLSQQRPVPSGVTVRDVVEFGRTPHRGRWKGRDAGGAAAVQRAMALTGTADLAERGVDELSGGQLQRVWLAGCLAQQTDVLLLDEPTNHLDLRYQIETLDLMDDLAHTHGITVGVVLHDLDQAAAVADRVVVLSAGRVVADGPPHHALTTQLLSEVYGIEIAVDIDAQTGLLRTRGVGRHSTRIRGPITNEGNI